MYQSGTYDLVNYSDKEKPVNLAGIEPLHSRYWAEAKKRTCREAGVVSIWRFHFCVPNIGDVIATALGADAAVFAAAESAREMGAPAALRMPKKAAD